MSRAAPLGDARPGTANLHPIADAYVLWRLFKEALRRITGVPTNASFLATVFALGVLATLCAESQRLPSSWSGPRLHPSRAP
jgi:hypothetical protein